MYMDVYSSDSVSGDSDSFVAALKRGAEDARRRCEEELAADAEHSIADATPPDDAGATFEQFEGVQEFRSWLEEGAERPPGPNQLRRSAPPLPPEPPPAAFDPPIADRKLEDKAADKAAKERYWRERMHPTPEIVEQDEQGTTYRLNKNWVTPYVDVQREFVVLTQFFYDLAPWVLSDKMSTTVYVDIKKLLITYDSNNTKIHYLNSNLIDLYSSRHSLSLAPPSRIRSTLDWESVTPVADWLTIREKTNWTRTQVNEIRKSVWDYSHYGTAIQVEHLANDFCKALRLPSPEQPKAAIDKLGDSIRVDTRSKSGRPKDWYELPLDPPQKSVAYLRKRFNDWTLWIANSPNSAPSTRPDCPPVSGEETHEGLFVDPY